MVGISGWNSEVEAMLVRVRIAHVDLRQGIPRTGLRRAALTMSIRAPRVARPASRSLADLAKMSSCCGGFSPDPQAVTVWSAVGLIQPSA